MTIRLTSGPATVVVDPDDGGRLVSLTLDDIELLGFGTAPPDEPDSWFYGSFPMAPFAGRLKDGRFRFEGIDYVIPPNFGPHSAHGVVFDVPWRVLREPTSTELMIETTFDDRWPFGGRVEQELSLSDSELRMTLRAHNDDRPMPVALGFHPWFRREIATGARASYDIRPGLRYAPDEDGVPRILTTDLGARPWDDVLTNLEMTPTISWPSGPTLRLTSNSEIWVVFERQADGFCIEPITAPPDSLGTDRATTVGPGKPVELQLIIGW